MVKFTKEMKLLILNGPNLNLLGKREPDVYGTQDFDSFYTDLIAHYEEHTIDHKQSNVEGELIDILQAADSDYDAVILNAGGYTHTSVALGDCVKAISVPVIELHISNVFAREEFRHTSMLSAHCKAVICGFGLDGYRMALVHLLMNN